jgi:hypothetical protein
MRNLPDGPPGASFLIGAFPQPGPSLRTRLSLVQLGPSPRRWGVVGSRLPGRVHLRTTGGSLSARRLCSGWPSQAPLWERPPSVPAIPTMAQPAPGLSPPQLASCIAIYLADNTVEDSATSGTGMSKPFTTLTLLKGKEPLLRHVTCEVRYDNGYLYLDHCGRLLKKLVGDQAEWVVAPNPTPQGTTVLNMLAGTTLGFNFRSASLTLDRTVDDEIICARGSRGIYQAGW